MNTKIVETKVTLESISKLITKSIANLATKDDLNKAISNLPTRDEMNTAIENSYDDLARVVVKSFAGVDKRIGDLEQKVDRNYTGLTNQLDYVLLHYTRRVEHEKLDLRIKRLEKLC